MIQPVAPASVVRQPVADLEKYMDAVSSKISLIETMVEKVRDEFPDDPANDELLTCMHVCVHDSSIWLPYWLDPISSLQMYIWVYMFINGTDFQ